MVRFTFPLYTFFFRNQHKVVDLTTTQATMVAMFTTEENADLYKERASVDYTVVKIPGPAEGRALVAALTVPGGFRIVFDPIAPDAREFLTISPEQFLEGCDSVLQPPAP